MDFMYKDAVKRVRNTGMPTGRNGIRSRSLNAARIPINPRGLNPTSYTPSPHPPEKAIMVKSARYDGTTLSVRWDLSDYLASRGVVPPLSMTFSCIGPGSVGARIPRGAYHRRNVEPDPTAPHGLPKHPQSPCH